MEASNILYVLPLHVFFIIREYLTSKEWFLFLQTSNQDAIIKELLDITWIWRLTSHYSLKFLTDLEFRKTIFERITFPSKQLALKLNHSLDNHFRSEADNEHSPDQLDQRDNYISLHSIFNEDGPFRSVYMLELTECVVLTDDIISCLQHIKYLRLVQCPNISNVNILHNAVKLDLNDCQAITDVSELNCVHHLVLCNCQGITDISRLGNEKFYRLEPGNDRIPTRIRRNQKIEILYCLNITKFENLQCLEYLHIHSCSNLLHTKGMENIAELELRYCDKLADISNIGISPKQHKLTLENCPELTSIHPMLSIRYLELCGCSSVLDALDLRKYEKLETLVIDNMYFDVIGGLGLRCDSSSLNANLKQTKREIYIEASLNVSNLNQFQHFNKVTVIDCVLVEDVSSLGNVCELTLNGLERLKDISCLGLNRQRKVNLMTCRQITDVSCLSNLVECNLTWCENVVDVSSLGTVPKLILDYCKNLSDIGGLGKGNRYLSLQYCPLIKAVNHLSTVHILYLIGCKSIEDVSGLGKVQRLYLDRCYSLHHVNLLGLGDGHQVLSCSFCPLIKEVNHLKNVYELHLDRCASIVDVDQLADVPILTASGENIRNLHTVMEGRSPTGHHKRLW
jgi:hypothetical protein